MSGDIDRERRPISAKLSEKRQRKGQGSALDPLGPEAPDPH